MNEIQLLENFKQYIHSSDRDSSSNRLRFKFPNGFGASVIRGEHSYGGNEGLFELGVLIFDENDRFGLHYSNPVAKGDVVGYLTIEKVSTLLLEIMNFIPERIMLNDK